MATVNIRIELVPEQPEPAPNSGTGPSMGELRAAGASMALESLLCAAITTDSRVGTYYARAEAIGATRERAEEALHAEQYEDWEEGAGIDRRLVRYSRAGSTPTGDECQRAFSRLVAGVFDPESHLPLAMLSPEAQARRTAATRAVFARLSGEQDGEQQ